MDETLLLALSCVFVAGRGISKSRTGSPAEESQKELQQSAGELPSGRNVSYLVRKHIGQEEKITNVTNDGGGGRHLMDLE